MNEFQRTDSWYQDRLGKATPSRMGDLMAKTKTGYGASRGNYMAELLIERLTGAPTESYQSPAMLRGIEAEPAALAAYGFETDFDLGFTGFVNHPRIKMAGCSPDGLVGSKGLVEVKCPNTATHIETLLNDSVDLKYMRQMQFQLACHPDREWCDYVSYDGRMPPGMQMWVKRFDRDDKIIELMEQDVEVFLAELDEKEQALRERYGEAA